jgi:hypothetical protein
MPAQPPQPPEHLSQLARIKSFLGENSRLYGFLRSAKKRLFEARRREPPPAI